MTFSEDVLKNEEKAMMRLRGLYGRYGYAQYKMSKFEEYDLYVRNKSFLASDQIITFNDTSGKLMALKPDVTLSIVKNTKDCGVSLCKYFYNENVYRLSHTTGEFKERLQVGLECIGSIDLYSMSEVIALAEKSLETISSRYVLDISPYGLSERSAGRTRPLRRAKRTDSQVHQRKKRALKSRSSARWPVSATAAADG